MKSMVCVVVFACMLASAAQLAAADAPRPNILWISCEDTSPWLGFCGEKYATTPHLDAMAHRGVYFTNAYVTAPVCSPSRFGIITGCYATSYGTQRLRSQFPVPDTIKGFPTYLRQAGYYCTNNVKTDYNTSAEPRIVSESWNECSGQAHWRHRKGNQPFFSVFNLMETHQSKVFETAPPPHVTASEKHDPAKAPIPPYYPDIPKSHWTMARVHDCITAMDKHVGRILAELEQDGLQNDTIVVFWPDHGQGIPRGKRTLWDTGLKIPVLVYFPEKYRSLAPAAPGGTCDRQISLMDLGPTMLSIPGLPIPAYMQGQPFLGAAATAPREYIFGARDRVDEALELTRSVRDTRYLYLRNFMPDLSWNQPETYSDQLALRRQITQLAAAGKLNADQLTYAGPAKPYEALYDTQNDPWQLKNLANEPEFRPILERLRKTLRDWQSQTRDVGMLNEWEQARLCQTTGRSLFELACDPARIPLERVLETAWLVGMPGRVEAFTQRLTDADPTVRYWAAIGLRVAAAAGENIGAARDALQKAAADESLAVRIEASAIMAGRFDDATAITRLAGLLGQGDDNADLYIGRAIQMLGEKGRPALAAMQTALPKVKSMFARWTLQGAISALNGEDSPVFKNKANKKAPKMQEPERES